jgi:hypothetical protein
MSGRPTLVRGDGYDDSGTHAGSYKTVPDIPRLRRVSSGIGYEAHMI